MIRRRIGEETPTDRPWPDTVACGFKLKVWFGAVAILVALSVTAIDTGVHYVHAQSAQSTPSPDTQSEQSTPTTDGQSTQPAATSNPEPGQANPASDTQAAQSTSTTDTQSEQSTPVTDTQSGQPTSEADGQQATSATDTQPDSTTSDKQDSSPQDSSAANPGSLTAPTAAATPPAPVAQVPAVPKSPEELRKQEVASQCANLLKMATDLKTEINKTTKDELSISVVRKAGEIEQLAHKVRGDPRLTAGKD